MRYQPLTPIPFKGGGTGGTNFNTIEQFKQNERDREREERLNVAATK